MSHPPKVAKASTKGIFETLMVLVTNIANDNNSLIYKISMGEINPWQCTAKQTINISASKIKSFSTFIRARIISYILIFLTYITVSNYSGKTNLIIAKALDTGLGI